MNLTLIKTISLVLILFLGTCSKSRAEVRLANVFGDNMVLQVGQYVYFFGTADPGEKVSVELRDQVVNGVADKTGHWLIRTSPIELGEPFEVTVKGAESQIVLKNVVAGEVWICSGQSNMEWTVRNSGRPTEEIANANYPLIRHIKVRNTISPVPKNEVETTGWSVCSPETAADFTAVGYYFARHLHQELDVPIGLINTSWGGTIAEAWVSGQSLKRLPDFKERVLLIESSADNFEKDQIKFQASNEVWQKQFADAMADDTDNFRTVNVDVSEWKSIRSGQAWEQQGYPSVDGVAWYRQKIKLPNAMVGKPLKLSLGQIDDHDKTYVNGSLVGETNGHTQLRKYNVAKELTEAGELLIAIRATDTGGAGGMFGSAKNLFVSSDDGSSVDLKTAWSFKLGSKTASLPARPVRPGFAGPNNPTALYNAMVHPIIKTSFRGVIWYQGESNVGRAKQYQSLFPTLIRDWRQQQAVLRDRRVANEFPFYWVQLANFMAPSSEPGPSGWAELREAQSLTQSVENTGQAVIIDIGEARDIHPKNKQDVGRRLALHALAKNYGKEIVCSGPIYSAMQIEGNKIRISFKFAKGLQAKGGALKRFEIAGQDGKFVWAEANIALDEVVVSAKSVEDPVAVRYAWADNPEGCNLYNGADLPASPFRTDR